MEHQAGFLISLRNEAVQKFSVAGDAGYVLLPSVRKNVREMRDLSLRNSIIQPILIG
jgi:hypothetical protein